MVVSEVRYLYKPSLPNKVFCVNLAAKCSFSGSPYKDCTQYWASVLPPPVGPYKDTVNPLSPVNAYSGADNPTPKEKLYQGISTLSNNVGSGQAGVLKVPNVMTKGTNISFINTTDGAVETTYDGSTPITISSTDTDTLYNQSLQVPV